MQLTSAVIPTTVERHSHIGYVTEPKLVRFCTGVYQACHSQASRSLCIVTLEGESNPLRLTKWTVLQECYQFQLRLALQLEYKTRRTSNLHEMRVPCHY